MNLSRCSEVVVVALLVLSVVAGTAAAVETRSDGVPDDAEVGSEVTATYTFTELYSDYEEWTLRGETNMTNVTWTVRQFDQAGNRVDQSSYDGASFDEPVALESDTAEVRVKVTGTVPAVENYTYDPPQRFLLAGFEQTREGGASDSITSDEVHHFTQESTEARAAIDEASEAVEGSSSQEAERNLENAIEAYDGEQFQLATNLAGDAQQKAEQSKSTQSRNRMLMFGGLGGIALLFAVGGVYYWRSQQDSYDKLR